MCMCYSGKKAHLSSNKNILENNTGPSKLREHEHTLKEMNLPARGGGDLCSEAEKNQSDGALNRVDEPPGTYRAV